MHFNRCHISGLFEFGPTVVGKHFEAGLLEPGTPVLTENVRTDFMTDVLVTYTLDV